MAFKVLNSRKKLFFGSFSLAKMMGSDVTLHAVKKLNRVFRDSRVHARQMYRGQIIINPEGHRVLPYMLPFVVPMIRPKHKVPILTFHYVLLVL